MSIIKKCIKNSHHLPNIDATTSILSIPDDLITSILLYLPVKSLIRFKSVSKSWFSLLSDPLFVRNHLHTSTSANRHAGERILLKSYVTRGGLILHSCLLSSLFNQPSVDTTETSHQFQRNGQFNIIGSCNGLVCVVTRYLADTERVHLWNPTTRKSASLPVLGFESQRSCSTEYGFGYDSRTDDYKIVAIFDKKVMVYTLSLGSWRVIEDNFPHAPILGDEPGVFVGGALHWRVVHADIPVKHHARSWIIMAIDLATEKYTVIPHPPNVDDFVSLGKLGDDFLCLVANDNLAKPGVIWAMKEYGVKESWFKMFTIPSRYEDIDEDDDDYVRVYYLPVRWSSENGKLLLNFGSTWAMYKPEDMQFRCPEIHNIDGCNANAIPYVESLVSPEVYKG